MKLTPLLPLLTALILGSFSTATAAQARPAAQAPGGGPDVLILVAASPDGQDQIGITYAKLVPHAQALRDLSALRSATGWTLKRVKITDAASSLKRDRVKMTGIECIATHVFRPQTHGLIVQPFVQAFRPYRYFLLTYFVGDGFRFQGLHDYADHHVKITLDQHGGAFTYRVLILDPHFGRLDLPYLQTPAVHAPTGVQSAARACHGTGRRSTPSPLPRQTA